MIHWAIGIVPASTRTVDDGVEGTQSDERWPDGGVFVIKANAYLEYHGMFVPPFPASPSLADDQALIPRGCKRKTKSLSPTWWRSTMIRMKP
jgi:hypothetical protein